MKKLLPILTLAVLPLLATPALAGTSNLRCGNGFHKFNTHANSVTCKKTRGGFNSKQNAVRASQIQAKSYRRGGCNANVGTFKSRYFQKNGKWAYQAWFVCANIS